MASRDARLDAPLDDDLRCSRRVLLAVYGGLLAFWAGVGCGVAAWAGAL